MLQEQSPEKKNVSRARYSLPYLHSMLRDLITIIPPLLCLDKPQIGVYGHISCSRNEHTLLKKYLKPCPDAPVGRLPDRIHLESLIAIPRPSITSDFFSSVAIVAIPNPYSSPEKIIKKMRVVQGFLKDHGICSTTIIHKDDLPQHVIYEIMRVGIVLAGKYPVIRREDVTDSTVFIGELPTSLNDPKVPGHMEWDPFQCHLDTMVVKNIQDSDFPAPVAVKGINPFILPYIHIMHRYEENLDTDQLERFRTSLHLLYSSFPPTTEVIKELSKAWDFDGARYLTRVKSSFQDALKLRKWLVPLEENELPIVLWPPQKGFNLDTARIEINNGTWSISEVNTFRHKHLWVVVAWGIISGLIGKGTLIRPPTPYVFRRDIDKKMSELINTLMDDKKTIVPQDHLEGSIYKKKGRFFFSPEPFALLETGNKYPLELWREIKKKTLIDDIDLDKYKLK